MVFRGVLRNQSFGIKLVALIALAFFSMSIFTALSALLLHPLFGINIMTNSEVLMDLSNPQSLAAYKFLQIVQAISLFILPALAFPFLCGEKFGAYLKIDRAPTVFLVLLVLLIGYFSSPLFELSNQLNQKMTLPPFLQGLEDWMRAKENQLSDLTKAFLKMDNYGQLALNLFMMAVLAAFGEELLFRGIVQHLFIQWCKNVHLGIWVAAIVFSAVHFQFYGFLPRMLLGVLFGYLFYWSGNIWLAIIAHFINNATVVVFSYLFQHKFINYNIEDTAALPVQSYVVCLIISSLLLFVYYRTTTKIQPEENYGD